MGQKGHVCYFCKHTNECPELNLQEKEYYTKGKKIIEICAKDACDKIVQHMKTTKEFQVAEGARWLTAFVMKYLRSIANVQKEISDLPDLYSGGPCFCGFDKFLSKDGNCPIGKYIHGEAAVGKPMGQA